MLSVVIIATAAAAVLLLLLLIRCWHPLCRASEVANEPTHFETSPAEQKRAAAHEAWLMAHSPHEGRPAVPAKEAAVHIKSSGLARVDGVIGADAARELLTHIIAKVWQRPADHPKPLRFDVPLDLSEEPVRLAISHVLSVTSSALVQLLGKSPELHELGAVVAEPGVPSHRTCGYS